MVFTAVLVLSAAGTLAFAAGLTTLLLQPENPLDAAISFGVIAAAGAAATVLAAGAVGLLTPAAVLAAEAVWALVAGALVARWGMWPRRPQLRWPALRRHPWESAVVALAVIALAWQFLVAAVLPPFAYDALTYHLTMVASWVKAESIHPAVLAPCCAYYPANAELLLRLARPVLRR